MYKKEGKLLQDTDGHVVDRMPIVISGLNIEKLLAIPKHTMNTGQLMGNTVIQTLLNWKDVHDWFASICFHTTSSNPGAHTGAITVIWQVHHKHVLFLACRHHILEIISATVLKQFSIFS